MNWKQRSAGAIVVIVLAAMVWIRFLTTEITRFAGEDNVHFGIRSAIELVSGFTTGDGGELNGSVRVVVNGVQATSGG